MTTQSSPPLPPTMPGVTYLLWERTMTVTVCVLPADGSTFILPTPTTGEEKQR